MRCSNKSHIGACSVQWNFLLFLSSPSSVHHYFTKRRTRGTVDKNVLASWTNVCTWTRRHSRCLLLVAGMPFALSDYSCVSPTRICSAFSSLPQYQRPNTNNYMQASDRHSSSHASNMGGYGGQGVKRMRNDDRCHETVSSAHRMKWDTADEDNNSAPFMERNDIDQRSEYVATVKRAVKMRSARVS